jgi:hypothetical protein
MAGAPVNFAVTSTGAAIPIVSSFTPITSVYFENSGANPIYVGVAGVSSSLYISKIASGGSFNMSADSLGKLGSEIDLSKIYMNGTASDKLMVTYLVTKS